jgi:glycosyltransferase involved in cell wall biosynthesis
VNVLLLLAHSIEEHDQLRLLAGLGYDVFSIGGYIDPAHPHDPKRPALPDVPYHPELHAVVDGLGTPDNLRVAKEHIPDDLIDWADVIVCHHYEHMWLVPQWDRIRHKRVVWRTVGQSVANNEAIMAPLRRDGLQVVRYSPKERNIPGYIGEDALIRFYKDPAEWNGWVGAREVALNVTQHLFQRDPYTNFRFWAEATEGIDALAAGPGSEVLGGPGEVRFRVMQELLRTCRAYVYTGTQPASYTLGLIEAMMTGIPVVSIGPRHMTIFPYGPDLFEGHEIAGLWYDDAWLARLKLRELVADFDIARVHSEQQRARAVELFGMDAVGAAWKAFLG